MTKVLLAEQFASLPAAMLRAHQQKVWEARLKRAQFEYLRQQKEPMPQLTLITQAIRETYP